MKVSVRYRKPSRIALAVSLLLLAPAFPTTSVASSKLSNAGTLTCVAEESAGFVFGSTKFIKCTFDPAIAGVRKHYFRGHVRKFGSTHRGRSKTLVVWQVFSRGNFNGGRSLEGLYSNASQRMVTPENFAGLSGGKNGKIMLKPLTAKAGASGNSAIDVTELELVRVEVKA